MVNEGRKKNVILCFLLFFIFQIKYPLCYPFSFCYCIRRYCQPMSLFRRCILAVVMACVCCWVSAPGEWRSRNAYRDILFRFKCVSTAGVFRIDTYDISRLPRHAALHKMPADDGCSNLEDERKPAEKKKRTNSLPLSVRWKKNITQRMNGWNGTNERTHTVGWNNEGDLS